jgi:hypothetical protein
MSDIQEMSDALIRTLDEIKRNREAGNTAHVSHYQASLYAFVSYHQHDCTFANRSDQRRMVQEYDSYIEKYKAKK